MNCTTCGTRARKDWSTGECYQDRFYPDDSRYDPEWVWPEYTCDNCGDVPAEFPRDGALFCDAICAASYNLE